MRFPPAYAGSRLRPPSFAIPNKKPPVGWFASSFRIGSPSAHFGMLACASRRAIRLFAEVGRSNRNTVAISPGICRVAAPTPFLCNSKQKTTRWVVCIFLPYWESFGSLRHACLRFAPRNSPVRRSRPLKSQHRCDFPRHMPGRGSDSLPLQFQTKNHPLGGFLFGAGDGSRTHEPRHYQ